ncbi:MAG: lysophospholipid acyltransferase family protein [Alphaproteobacteria bacterium]
MRKWKLRPADDFGLSFRERLFSQRRETGLIGAVSRWLLWLIARAYLRLYHRIRFDGREHLPASAPAILVANHTSHLDAPALAAALPLGWCDRTFALAAGDTFFTSLGAAAAITALLNALPIWRKKTRHKQLAALRERLSERHCVYILFPEGSRSRDGALAKFKSGIGPIVAGTEVPIVPCHIDGAFAAFPPQRKWPLPRRLTVRLGPPLTFPDTANDMQGWDAIAAALETAVRKLASNRS